MLLDKIGGLGRTYRHIQRYRAILSVFGKHGFGDLVSSVNEYLDIGPLHLGAVNGNGEPLSRAVRVRMAFQELGASFIKMGQLLSTRTDLLPPDYIDELSRLQDEVPPEPFRHIKAMVESELGAPIGEVFAHFDERPLGAASIAQVHRARLKGGEEVVVKVQRPGIRQKMRVDGEIVLHLAKLLERHHQGWQDQRPSVVVEQLARNLNKETDFTAEIAHIERFAWMFRREETAHVPKVYREWSSSRVLTMEYVAGVKAVDPDLLRAQGRDPSLVARRAADLVMKQVFVHGYFHADPHPGNVFVLPENVLCFVDYGMMGQLDKATREDFADLMAAVARQSEAQAADALLRLTAPAREPDRRKLEKDIAEFMHQHFYRPMKEVSFGKLIVELLRKTSDHQLQLPPDVFLMLKAIGAVETLVRRLEPEHDILDQAGPFIRRIQTERLSPQRLVYDLAESAPGLARFLVRDLPQETRTLLRQARKGNLKLGLEHTGLERLTRIFDQVGNRLAFAIVLSGLIIGSSLIILANLPPLWGGMPIIGLVGFLLAGLMGIGLLVSILRHGRL